MRLAAEPEGDVVEPGTARGGPFVPHVVLAGVVLPLAVALRLPLLVRAASFFTSDEAIVGLIARHFSSGEYPAHFWGQGYMGTIESILAKMLFWLAGESVLVLKIAPLVFFLLFLVAHYDLTSLLTSRGRALLSTLVLAIGPPALVSWSVRAMAGYTETLFFGTVFLAQLVRFQRDPRRRLYLFLAGLSAGLGWWTSQLVACYLLAGLLLIFRSRIRGLYESLRARLSDWFWLRSTVVLVPPVLRMIFVALNALAVGYVLLGIFVLLTGGGELSVQRVAIRATDGWRLIRYGLTWVGIEILVLSLLSFRPGFLRACQRVSPFIGGFVFGLLPVITHSTQLAGAPAHRFSLPELLAQMPLFAERILPTVVGGSDAEGELIAWPLTLLLLAILALLLLSMRRTDIPLLALYLSAATCALFFFTGNFLDFASYRYLLPLYPAVSMLVAAAVPIRARTLIPLGLTLALWFRADLDQSRALVPDTTSHPILDWFRARKIETGFADYWIAYRLDFIGGEHPVLAPYHSHDRYPAYTARARSAQVTGYIFRVGDPEWPAFLRAKSRRVLDSAVIGRYRLYAVDQKKLAATSFEAAAESGYVFSPKSPR